MFQIPKENLPSMATFWSKNAFKVKARVRVLQITPAVGSILFLEESEGVTFGRNTNHPLMKDLGLEMKPSWIRPFRDWLKGNNEKQRLSPAYIGKLMKDL